MTMKLGDIVTAPKGLPRRVMGRASGPDNCEIPMGAEGRILNIVHLEGVPHRAWVRFPSRGLPSYRWVDVADLEPRDA